MTNMTVDDLILNKAKDILSTIVLSSSVPLEPPSVMEPRVVVVGKHGSGKDTFAAQLSSSLTYGHSQSHYVCPLIYRTLLASGLAVPSAEQFYKQRHRWSGYFKHLCDHIRDMKPSYLLDLNPNTLVTGVRSKVEILALARRASTFIWVARRVADDPTLEFTYEWLMASVNQGTVITVDNNSTLEDLKASASTLLLKLTSL